MVLIARELNLKANSMNGKSASASHYPGRPRIGPTVLVVEDDDELREALRDTLTISGFSTLTAEDGHTALALMSANAERLAAAVRADAEAVRADAEAVRAQSR